MASRVRARWSSRSARSRAAPLLRWPARARRRNHSLARGLAGRELALAVGRSARETRGSVATIGATLVHAFRIGRQRGAPIREAARRFCDTFTKRCGACRTTASCTQGRACVRGVDGSACQACTEEATSSSSYDGVACVNTCVACSGDPRCAAKVNCGGVWECLRKARFPIGASAVPRVRRVGDARRTARVSPRAWAASTYEPRSGVRLRGRRGLQRWRPLQDGYGPLGTCWSVAASLIAFGGFGAAYLWKEWQTESREEREDALVADASADARVAHRKPKSKPGKQGARGGKARVGGGRTSTGPSGGTGNGGGDVGADDNGADDNGGAVRRVALGRHLRVTRHQPVRLSRRPPCALPRSPGQRARRAPARRLGCCRRG